MVLKEVETEKYMGVLLSNTLSWSPHIDAVACKASQKFIRINHYLNASLKPPSVVHLYKCGLMARLRCYNAVRCASYAAWNTTYTLPTCTMQDGNACLPLQGSYTHV